MLVLTRSQFQVITATCQAAYPDEGCGALLGTTEDDRHIVAVVEPLDNVSNETRRRRFEISSDDLLRLMRQERATGLKVLGYFHSHPDHPPIPSSTDKAAAWPGYSYPIISVVAGIAATWNSWRLRDDETGYDPELVSVIEGP